MTTDDRLKTLTLLKQAVNGMMSQPPEWLLWRLVDAAGLVSESSAAGKVGQPGSPTGRGYSIHKVGQEGDKP
ncbi:MAG: hypothetical protein ACE5FM_00010 [Methyloligellaceae bacterium]